MVSQGGATLAPVPYEFEDDDYTTFARMEGLRPGGGDEDGVLSSAAGALHSASMVRSWHDGHHGPGFVSDDYLDDISAETMLTALELTHAH